VTESCATAVVRQRAEQGVSPMSDCRRRALLSFCKVRVSRHKARGVQDCDPLTAVASTWRKPAPLRWSSPPKRQVVSPITYYQPTRQYKYSSEHDIRGCFICCQRDRFGCNTVKH